MAYGSEGYGPESTAPSTRHRVRPDPAAVFAVPVLVGAAVAVALGVYGRLHTPTGVALNVAGFSGAQAAKTWLTTVALLFGLVQVGTALAMAGRLPPGPEAPWLPGLHRWSGRIAVLIMVPVLVHCLYALGFQTATPRVLLHSIAGCFFFGVFATKMLLLSRPGVPAWAVPLAGGLVFTGLVVLWLTSAFWFFTNFGLTR